MKKEIQLNYDVIKIIQRLELERNAIISILDFLKTHQNIEVNVEKYKQDLEKKDFEYKTFLKAIKEFYIDPLKLDINNWFINYRDSTIIICAKDN